MILAVDGGGTKTIAILVNEQNEIVRVVKGPRSNPTALTQNQFEQHLHQLLTSFSLEERMTIRSAFVGLAGVIETNNQEMTQLIFNEYLQPQCQLTIVNDALNALYSGTLGQAGIVQIAGTGAITYAVDDLGKAYRSGGWGYLIDDEGSGYDLGVQALKSIFKAYDGRGVKTSLSTVICRHFDVSSPPQLIEILYDEKQHPRSIIAPLSRHVVQQAKTGDDVAKGIIVEACEKLLQSIRSCARQGTWVASPSVVLAGGVFGDITYFIEQLNSLDKTFNYVAPYCQPIGGAIAGAYAQLGIPVDVEFLRQLHHII